jgi:hypothetical protein
MGARTTQAPTSENVTVGRRSREYLTEREVERLIEAAKQNRCGHRDATAILVAYRHGLRASEVIALRWDDIDLTTGRLHVRRAKGGDASVHPISARESRALRKLLREAPTSPYVFISERGAPLSAARYQRMVARAGVAAKFTFLVHSHMLRHACGFKFANDGHDTRAIQAYLGPPLDHVHRPLHGVDAQSFQKFLEGLSDECGSKLAIGDHGADRCPPLMEPPRASKLLARLVGCRTAALCPRSGDKRTCRKKSPMAQLMIRCRCFRARNWRSRVAGNPPKTLSINQKFLWNEASTCRVSSS